MTAPPRSLKGSCSNLSESRSIPGRRLSQSTSLKPNRRARIAERFEEKPVIPPPKRLARVRLNVRDLAIAKTNNLQPYLFKVLQEQDAGAEVDVTIQVSSSAGIPQDVLEQRIVEAFDQLGIALQWEEG